MEALKNYKKFFLLSLFFGVVFCFNFNITSSPQWVELSRSFLNYHLDFIHVSDIRDTADYGGKIFWPLGPLPAIFLMPFVFLADSFGIFFKQGYVQPFIALVIFLLILRIGQQIGFKNGNNFWLAFAFCFASPFLLIAVSPGWGQLAYLFSVFFIFLGISEHLSKNRPVIIGLAFGLAAASRLTAGLGIIFFILEALTSSRKITKEIFKRIIFLTIPILASVLLIGIYNYLRFDNFFEQGYSYQNVTTDALAKARNYGLMNLVHIPGNLYYFLLSAPVPIFKDGLSHVLKFPYIKPDPWGMGIFFSSPYLLTLFFLSKRDRISKLLLLTCGIVALPIILYYGIGYSQIGYRYALDFLPLIFFLLARNYFRDKGQWSLPFKFAVFFSGIFNLYLLLVYFSHV